MNMSDFKSLPLSVREDVKNTLKAYNECNIRFYNDEYHVSTGIMLCSKYPDDYRIIGDVHKDDIYTPDEQIVNYIETFYDYPREYKGKRDYDMLRYMATQSGKSRVRLVDGTAALVI